MARHDKAVAVAVAVAKHLHLRQRNYCAVAFSGEKTDDCGTISRIIPNCSVDFLGSRPSLFLQDSFEVGSDTLLVGPDMTPRGIW